MQKYETKLRCNIKRLYAGAFLFELLFFIPILVPFLEEMGLAMSQILMLEASFALAMVILEIPSGYFADLYGRVTALFLGSLIAFFGVFLFVVSHSFWGFLVAELTIGAGMSMVSGTVEALLYDTLVELKSESNYRKIQGMVFLWERIGSVASNIAGAALASLFFLRMPFYASLIPFGAWVLINSTLTEPRRHKKAVETWSHFARILKETLGNRQLCYFVLYAAIPPAFFLMSFWMYQRYMEWIGLPLFYFGIVIAGMNVFSGLGAKYSHQIEGAIGLKNSLMLVPVVASTVWLALANFKTAWALPLLFLVSGLWGFFQPLFLDFLQKMASSDRRATVISIRGFLTRVIFFALGPFLGWMADLYTVQAAFMMSATLLLLLTGPGLLMLKKVKIL